MLANKRFGVLISGGKDILSITIQFQEIETAIQFSKGFNKAIESSLNQSRGVFVENEGEHGSSFMYRGSLFAKNCIRFYQIHAPSCSIITATPMNLETNEVLFNYKKYIKKNNSRVPKLVNGPACLAGKDSTKDASAS